MEMLRPSAVEAEAICDAGVIFDVKRNQLEVSTLGALRCAALRCAALRRSFGWAL